MSSSQVHEARPSRARRSQEAADASPAGSATLEFDRGTLVLRHWSGPCAAEDLPGMRWDERIQAFRAPARYRASIQEFLARLGAPLPRARSGAHGFGSAASPDLRPYQEAALDAWLLEGRRGIVVLPTGSGKTLVAAAAIARSACPTICLVPTRILLAQWSELLARVLGTDVGRYGDGEREARAVTVATFESALRHMPSLGDRFELVVVDEAHHFGGGSRDEALDMCAAGWRLGLTATPPDGPTADRLSELIGPSVYRLGIADLTGSFLAPFGIVELQLGLTPEERRDHDRDWGEFRAAFDHFRDLAPHSSWADFLRWAGRTAGGRAALRAWRRGRSRLGWTHAKSEAVGKLLRRHAASRVLLFTADKEAAYRIAREHLVMPITADIGRREREEALEAFREGRLRALVSARVLNEGIDVPEADVGVVVGGALGEREHVQRVGRLLRPAPGKEAVVYELVTRGTPEVPRSRRRRRGLLPRSPRAV